MLNIEASAAAAAQTIGAVTMAHGQALVRKTGLILSEQGLFALGLFLATRKDESATALAIHRAIHQLLQLSGLAPAGEDPTRVDVEYYRQLVSARAASDEGEAQETEAQALYRILLTQRILDRMLSYAVYYSKISAESEAG